ASSRRATRLSAPSGSPAASARAAAVISESIGIPPHLSLSQVRCPVLNLSPDHQPARHIDDGSSDAGTLTKGRKGTMSTDTTGTREEWLAARLQLLNEEKELTRRSDELAQQRQALPWVRVDKQYRFATEAGNASLGDLFQGRSQLLVYHFMFGPDY